MFGLLGVRLMLLGSRVCISLMLAWHLMASNAFEQR